jgi:hypothetical protein
MELFEGIATLVNQIRQIRWEWSKASMRRIASDLGLVDPTTGSDQCVEYRSITPHFLSENEVHPYAFAIRGEELLQFSTALDEFDMGETWLDDAENYYEVCNKQHAIFRSNFKKAVKTITKLLGKPSFNGGRANPNMVEAEPFVLGYELVAMWSMENARLMLAYGQEDKELPITLELFVFPPKTGD